MSTTLTRTDPYVIEIQEELLRAGIVRTDADVERALLTATSHVADVRGWWADYASIHNNSEAWWHLLHGPTGVYDLLEIDSEDYLHDRLEGEAL